MKTMKLLAGSVIAVALCGAGEARATDYTSYTANSNLTLAEGDTLTVSSGDVDISYGGSGTGLARTLNASLAASVTFTIDNLRLGTRSDPTITATSDRNGVLNLGTNNNITASALVAIGGGGHILSASLTTAENSTTVINTPVMDIGTALRTSSPTPNLTIGSGSTFTLQGISGGRTALTVGEERHASSGINWSSSGTMDLAGGQATLKLSSLVVGRSVFASSEVGTATGTMTLSGAAANQLDVSGTGSVIQVGVSAGNQATGTMTIDNLGSNSTITSTDNGDAILVGNRTTATGDAVAGTLNLNGGTVTITTTGAAIAGGANATSTLNLSGGVTLKAGASSANWIKNLTTATIGAGGATIDTDGKTNVISQAFSGAGGLVKAGTGTLTLSGNNSYAGTTTVSNGTLLVTGTVAAGTVTAKTGASFGGTGSVGGDIVLEAGSKGLLTATAGTPTPLAVTGSVTFDGNVVQVNVPDDLAAGAYPLITAGGILGSLGALETLGGTPAGEASLAVVDNSLILTVEGDLAAPTDLIATPGHQQVLLSWTASDGATGYKVVTSNSVTEVVVTNTTENTSYLKTGLDNGTEYGFRVAANSLAGDSDYTAWTSATPDAIPPAAPTGLTATPSTQQIALSWDAVLLADGYDVLRAATSDGTYSSIGTTTELTSFTDSPLDNRATWYYKVAATNGAGATASDWVTATTLAADLINSAGTVSGTYDKAQIGYRTGPINNTVSGGTSLSIGTGASDYLFIGVGYNGSAGTGTLDVESADSFTANVGRLWVGISTGINPLGAGSSGSGGIGTGTLKLGNANTITATSILVGGAETDTNSGVTTGAGTVTTIASGTTTITTPYMALGTGKGTSGSFTLGSAATLSLGTTDDRTLLILGRRDTAEVLGTGRPVDGTMNLSGGASDDGIANLALSGLRISWNTYNAQSGSTLDGTMTLSANASNHLDIQGAGNVVQIGVGTGTAGSYTASMTGLLTIGNLDATSVIESTTEDATAILIGAKPSGAGSVVSGTLDFKQGTLTIKTAGTAGAAIAGGGFANTRALLLGETGRVTLKAGASSTDWIKDLTTAEIKSGGLTIDTVDKTNTISQAFSGAGGLVKDGSGTLTLSGSNLYTGETIVSNGTLLVTGSVAGTVSAKSGASFGGTGSVGGNVVLEAGAEVVLTVGSPLTVTGSLALNNNVVNVHLPEDLGPGAYPLMTFNTTGSTGSINPVPNILSGSAKSSVSVMVSGNTVYLVTEKTGSVFRFH